MAHWAQVDENNIVTQVTVGSNDEPDEGYQWLIDNLGGRWIKTSWNTIGNTHLKGGTPLRGNYASVGDVYDEELDVFYAPQPYPSWVLNESTYTWEPPVTVPNDGQLYEWNENTQSWDLVPG